MRFLALAASLHAVAASGSWRAAPPADVNPGGHIHDLARFSLSKLTQHCAASNSIVCSRLGPEASMLRVRSAQTQVVSGINFQIEVETSAGTLHLKIWEQSWSNTLVVTEATLTLPPAGMSLAMLQESLLEEELALDAAEFATAVAAAGAAAPPTVAAVAAVATEPCTPHDAICTREYMPVCSAGRTYSNMCVARAACVKDQDAVPGPCAEEKKAESVPLMGGWSERQAAEFAANTRIHHLAAFSLGGLKAYCAASNALECNGLGEVTFDHVVSARSQVVAGTNYEIEALTSHGNLHLRLYERPWGAPTLELIEAILTRPQRAGLLGRTSGNLLVGQTRLPLDAAAFAAAFAAASKAKAKPSPLTTLRSAIMVGGAPGYGGGHYTGSDVERLAATEEPATATLAAVKPSPEPIKPDKTTQWWLFTFFVLGVALVASLAVIARKLQRNPQSEEPINTAPSSSAVDEGHEMRKGEGDSSIA